MILWSHFDRVWINDLALVTVEVTSVTVLNDGTAHQSQQQLKYDTRIESVKQILF